MSLHNYVSQGSRGGPAMGLGRLEAKGKVSTQERNRLKRHSLKTVPIYIKSNLVYSTDKLLNK